MSQAFRTEKELQTAVLQKLGGRGGLRIWRQNTGVAIPITELIRNVLRAAGVKYNVVTFGVPGQADITGIIESSGRRLEIELKGARGRQSEEQKRFQAMIKAHNGVYIIGKDFGRIVAEVEAQL